MTAAGDLVYSSASRLYVATTAGGPVLTTGDAPLPRVATTQVHAFALDGGGTTYTASGSFRGTVKDRWSFSEHDGRLRVAAELPGARGPVDNGVLVLAERDGRLWRPDASTASGGASRSGPCAGSATWRSS